MRLALARRLHTGAAMNTVLETPDGLEALPFGLRLVLADLLANVLEGERAAAHVAQRIAFEDPSREARALALSQAQDERRHVDFFARVVGDLGIERPANPAVRELMATAKGAQTLPELLIGTNLVIETLGHALFKASAGLCRKLSSSRLLRTSARATMAQLAAGFLEVQRDESRHLAFGVLRLKQLRAAAPADERAELDRGVADARRQLRGAFLRMPLLVLLRPWLKLGSSSVLAHFDARANAVGVAS